MNRPRIILIGAGGHAHACIDVIEQDGKYGIAGLVGMREQMHTRHLGYAVIGTDSDLPQLAERNAHAIITVGQIHSPRTRIRLYQEAVALGFDLPSIVAPSAYVAAQATIGAGTIVMHGAIINAGAKVGRNCIINTKALIEHDASIDDHCHVSTGAIVNGSVSIGSGSFVGSGCVIKDGIRIGKNCVLGVGLCVRHDQADNSKFTGRNKS